MLTVAVIAQKGGSGKTTLAINLAIAAVRAKQQALVVDLDPQGSAAAWGRARESDAPVIVPARAAELTETLTTAREHGAKFVLIDTAPHAEQPALVAARSADLVLIPCRASILDLRAITVSHDISALANTRAVAVLNGIPPRGTLGDEAETALQSHGLPVAPVRTGHRVDFVHAATSGAGVLETRPTGKAAREITQLYAWLRREARRPQRMET